MSAVRHHLALGTMTQDQLLQDIEADLRNAEAAYVRVTRNGQHNAAVGLRREIDDYLNELAAVRAGTWRPAHA